MACVQPHEVRTSAPQAIPVNTCVQLQGATPLEAQGSAVARECAHGHRHATHQPTRNYTDKLNRRQLDALGHRLIDFDLDSGSAGQVQRVQMSSGFLHTFFMCSDAAVRAQVCRASPSSSARTIAGDPICLLVSKCIPAKWVANRVRRHSC